MKNTQSEVTSKDPELNSQTRPAYTLFINEKPAQILAAIQDPRVDSYGRPISRAIDSTYSHTLKTLHKLENYNLIEMNTKGRRKIACLTEEGEQLAEHTQVLLNTFDEIDDNVDLTEFEDKPGHAPSSFLRSTE